MAFKLIRIDARIEKDILLSVILTNNMHWLRKLHNACAGQYLKNPKLNIDEMKKIILLEIWKFRKKERGARKIDKGFFNAFIKKFLSQVKRNKINPEKFKIKLHPLMRSGFKFSYDEFETIWGKDGLILKSKYSNLEIPIKIYNKDFLFELKPKVVLTNFRVRKNTKRVQFQAIIFFKKTNDYMKYHRNFYKEKIENEKISCVAIDVGVRKLAVLSDGKIFKMHPRIKFLTEKIDDLKAYCDLYKKKNPKRVFRIRRKICAYWDEIDCLKENSIKKVINYLLKSKYNIVFIENNMELTYIDTAKEGWKYSRILQSSMFTLWNYIKKIDNSVNKFKVIEIGKAYTSQRCSKCKVLDKTSRHGEIYICNSCGFEIDADLNASRNLHLRGLEKLKKMQG